MVISRTYENSLYRKSSNWSSKQSLEVYFKFWPAWWKPLLVKKFQKEIARIERQNCKLSFILIVTTFHWLSNYLYKFLLTCKSFSFCYIFFVTIWAIFRDDFPVFLTIFELVTKRPKSTFSNDFSLLTFNFVVFFTNIFCIIFSHFSAKKCTFF